MLATSTILLLSFAWGDCFCQELVQGMCLVRVCQFSIVALANAARSCTVPCFFFEIGHICCGTILLVQDTKWKEKGRWNIGIHLRLYTNSTVSTIWPNAIPRRQVYEKTRRDNRNQAADTQLPQSCASAKSEPTKKWGTKAPHKPAKDKVGGAVQELTALSENQKNSHECRMCPQKPAIYCLYWQSRRYFSWS